MRGAISNSRVSTGFSRSHCEFRRFQVEVDDHVFSARRKVSTLSISDAERVICSCSTRRKAGFDALKARALRDFQQEKFKRTIDGFQRMAFELLASGSRRKAFARDVSLEVADCLREGKSVNQAVAFVRMKKKEACLSAKQSSSLECLLREFEPVVSVEREALAFVLRACESVLGRVSPKQNVFLKNFSRQLLRAVNANSNRAKKIVDASAQVAAQIVDASGARSVVVAGVRVAGQVVGSTVHAVDSVSPLSVRDAVDILNASLQKQSILSRVFSPLKNFFVGVQDIISDVFEAFSFTSLHAAPVKTVAALIIFASPLFLNVESVSHIPSTHAPAVLKRVSVNGRSELQLSTLNIVHIPADGSAPVPVLSSASASGTVLEATPRAPSDSFYNFVFEKKEGKKRVSEASREHLKDYGAAFLVMGTDTREGNAVGRADSLHLIVFHESDNIIYIASLSRDLFVDVPGHGKQKINQASSLGGPELEVEAVENFLGVKIDGYFECSVARFAKAYDAIRSIFSSSVSEDANSTSSSPIFDADEFGARDGKELARALQLRGHPDSKVPKNFKNTSKSVTERTETHARLLERVLRKGVGFHKANPTISSMGLGLLLDPLIGSATVNSDVEVDSLLRFAELVERRFPNGFESVRLLVSGKGGRDHSIRYYDDMRRVWSNGVWVETPEQLPEEFEGTRFYFELRKLGARVAGARHQGSPPI